MHDKIKKKKPLITIVTVVYNGQNYLEETILSVINQKYSNLEFIVIDGGSTDRTLDIIRKYENQIDYWISEKDNGIYDAMNKAFKVAKGKWINFMNCGDTFCDNNVIDNIEFQDLSECSMIYGNSRVFNGDRSFLKAQKAFKMNKINLSLFITGVVCHQSVFYNCKIKFNYPERYKFKGELYSYFEYLKFGNAAHINLDICNFYLEGIGRKEIKKNMQEVWSVLKEQVGIMRYLYLPMRILQFIKYS